MSNELKHTSQNKHLVLPLVLAFLPSVFLLLLTIFVNNGNPPAPLLFVLAGISVVFGSIASVLLIRRKTTLTIVFGILFLLLNGAISFIFGFGAILSGL